MIAPGGSGLWRCGPALILGLALTGARLSAQEPSEEPDPPQEEDPKGLSQSESAREDEVEIIVRGEALRGRTIGGYEPEQVLLPEDILAYGAGSLGELVDLILAETSSARGPASGPPIVLINGRWVSGFREVGRYPVSAVARVEVLPEEASLAYGFAADQRVLNFVLKRNVNITTLTVRGGGPLEGAGQSGEIDGQFLKVDGARRFSLDGTLGGREAVFESERNLVFADGTVGSPNLTLAPQTRDRSAGFSASLGLPGQATATLSGSVEDERSEALFGLDAITGDVVAQVTETTDLFTGLTLASGLRRSTWTVTGSFSDRDQETLTLAGGAVQNTQEARLSRQDWQGNAVLNQRLADLAAGPLTLSGSLDIRRERQLSAVTFGLDESVSGITRDAFEAGFSLEVPLLAPEPIPGEFGVNVNGEARRFSEFGWLTTRGFGLRWKPVPSVRLLVSTTREETAPSLADLGAPEVTIPDARIFDFLSGEDRLAALVTGGNPDLLAGQRRVVKVGLQWVPSNEPRLSVNLDYTRARTDNDTRRFAVLTPEFEAAFPDRVTRGSAGELLAFDLRPVQAVRGSRDELRTAITFSKRLKTKRKRRRAEGPPTKRRRSGRPGSLRISAVHRLTLRDQVQLSESGEGLGLDLLRGAAIEQPGGTARHRLDVSLYRWKYGFGLAAIARYQSATRVDNPSGELRFSKLATFGLRTTYEFNYSDAILRKLPFLEETQVAFNIGNIFNARQRVRDRAGGTPDSFLPKVLDPFGRSVRVDIRKRF